MRKVLGYLLALVTMIVGFRAPAAYAGGNVTLPDPVSIGCVSVPTVTSTALPAPNWITVEERGGGFLGCLNSSKCSGGQTTFMEIQLHACGSPGTIYVDSCPTFSPPCGPFTPPLCNTAPSAGFSTLCSVGEPFCERFRNFNTPTCHVCGTFYAWEWTDCGGNEVCTPDGQEFVADVFNSNQSIRLGDPVNFTINPAPAAGAAPEINFHDTATPLALLLTVLVILADRRRQGALPS